MNIHPVPYQGSKRLLASQIGDCVPTDIVTWYEPFAGSASMTIWAAQNRNLQRIVLGESLRPLAELWRCIIDEPERTARRYCLIWNGQTPGDRAYFNTVRARFNASGDPVDLLYLLCRCVKNAVRFNRQGAFSQSVDHRRLGMRPERMASAIHAASALLRGRTEIRVGDWLDTLADAGPKDFVYLDPPYLGTSGGRDRRYDESMTPARLIEGLRRLDARDLRFVLSYDGHTSGRSYGDVLPAHLGLSRIELPAGRSAQATLNGFAAWTFESLYLCRTTTNSN